MAGATSERRPSWRNWRSISAWLRVSGLLGTVALAGRLLGAQAAGIPTFDVASVKPNHSSDTESASVVQPGGRYIATNVTVRMLVKSAYGLHDTQLVGGPSWINSERFDISADHRKRCRWPLAQSNRRPHFRAARKSIGLDIWQRALLRCRTWC